VYVDVIGVLEESVAAQMSIISEPAQKPQNVLVADYLVIGAGAMGMAFVDELLNRSAAARIILVDRYAGPGGHWRRAYPYVALHQPSAFYGVNSETLGQGGKSLASGLEVVAYFQRVLEKHIAGGRLSFYPHCESDGSDQFQSTVTGEKYKVDIKHKLVDATYMEVEVPSMRKPPYRVSHGVEIIPPNGLVEIVRPYDDYIVVGAGKTGMDAIIYLLDLSVSPDRIIWIMPNDAWLLDRDNIHPDGLLDTLVAQQEVIAQSQTLDLLLTNLEERGMLLRIDRSIWAEKYRCATVDRRELEQLQRVKNVVRRGRVVNIDDETVNLERGKFTYRKNTLFIDCSANGLSNRPETPIFAGQKLTLQSVSMCQQVYSAALIAYVEIAYQDEDFKNQLCQVVPHPESIDDFLYATRVGAINLASWTRHFSKWLANSRLSFRSHIPTWRLMLRMARIKKLEPSVAKNLQAMPLHRQKIVSLEKVD
jgi:hypothetical protein